ncbi:MAG: LysM peptidoglycan-binding domain-containing protein [Actinomycetes bacterium]
MALAAPFPAAGRTHRVRPVPAARSTRSTTSAYAGVRLTSRGRALLMLGSALFLLLAIIASGRFTADAGSAAPARAATSVVVVQSGENLWQIARRLAPGADPREIVTQLRVLNHLGSTPVEAGQSIVVPAYDTP